jgi:hypothetical protein
MTDEEKHLTRLSGLRYEGDRKFTKFRNNKVWKLPQLRLSNLANNRQQTQSKYHVVWPRLPTETRANQPQSKVVG